MNYFKQRSGTILIHIYKTYLATSVWRTGILFPLSSPTGRGKTGTDILPLGLLPSEWKHIVKKKKKMGDGKERKAIWG